MKSFVIFGLLGLALYGLGSSLLPLVLAAVGAVLSLPLIDWLKKKGIGTPYSTILIILGVFVPLAALATVLVPLFVDELKDFLLVLPQSLTSFLDQIEAMAVQVGVHFDYSRADIIELVNRHATDLSVNVLKLATDTLKRSAGNLTGLILSTLNIFLIPVFYFYLVSERPYWQELIQMIVPSEYRPKLMRAMKKSTQVLKSYLQGQFLACLTLSTLYALGLHLVGLKFGAVIGIITGSLSFMPYVGFSLGFVSGLVVAFSMGQGFGFVALVVSVFLLVQFLESFVVTPKLVGHTVGLTPLESILLLIIFGNLLGFGGMLVAIPAGAILKTLVGEYLS